MTASVRFQMSSQHEDERENDTMRQRLRNVLDALSKLPAEQRIDIYEDLFGRDKHLSEDEQMLALHRRMFPPNPAINTFRREDVEISDDGLIVKRKPRVFLSHSHSDYKLARSIYRYLKKAGVYVWFDEAELRFGDSLIEKLRSAIDSVDVLLALISRSSIQSEWVKKEIDIAMNQEIESRRVKVIPLLCDPIDPPGFLVGKLFADFQSSNARRRNLPKLAADIKAYLDEYCG